MGGSKLKYVSDHHGRRPRDVVPCGQDYDELRYLLETSENESETFKQSLPKLNNTS